MSSESPHSGPLALGQPDPGRDLYTVSRLNREVRVLLEGGFPLIWLEGEISNLARPASGHLYFTLKDDFAQVRCAMFRMRRRNLRFEPENGSQVRTRARVSLYEIRGEFQLVVEHMEEAGDGALRRRFEELKQRLHREGLFAAERKQPLPRQPHTIGVITSPTGAAIRDILTVLGRRWAGIEVLIYPVLVQGESAAADITATLRLAGHRDEVDVLLLARGGGSFEDLNAFNDEGLARAIAASRLPVVTGIGHEIDFTIADLVADRRAPTPSAAAELLSPDRTELTQQLEATLGRIAARMRALLEQEDRRLAWLRKRLEQQHPRSALHQRTQRLDELELRLQHSVRADLRRHQTRLGEIEAGLHRHSPIHRLAELRVRLAGLHPRLRGTIGSRLQQAQRQLQGISRALDAVSPLATLGRGYSIVSRCTDGRIVRRAQDVAVGDEVQARLASGRLRCTVDRVDADAG